MDQLHAKRNVSKPWWRHQTLDDLLLSSDHSTYFHWFLVYFLFHILSTDSLRATFSNNCASLGRYGEYPNISCILLDASCGFVFDNPTIVASVFRSIISYSDTQLCFRIRPAFLTRVYNTFPHGTEQLLLFPIFIY